VQSNILIYRLIVYFYPFCPPKWTNRSPDSQMNRFVAINGAFLWRRRGYITCVFLKALQNEALVSIFICY